MYSYFICKAKDKYAELRKIQIVVNNIFQTYGMKNAQSLPIIQNWLDRNGLQFFQTLTKVQQEVCKPLD